MSHPTRRAALAMLSLPALGPRAMAQASADVIRIVVPFAPGGGQDVLARILAPGLSSALGANVIVENRGGAGGAIGTAYVARAKPDGTTLLMAASSHTINSALDPTLPFDAVKDFTAVAHVGSGAMLVLVNARLPVKTVAELIAYAKARPHQLNYASAGVGSATHLAMAYFANQAGLDIVHVPYKSTAEALTHLLSGEAQAMIVPTLGSGAYVSNPGIHVLAVTSNERMADLKDVPTVRESGLPDYTFVSFFGLLGPAGMPADVVDRIDDATMAVMKDPAVASAIAQQGIAVEPMPARDFSTLLASHYERIKQIVAAAGLRG